MTLDVQASKARTAITDELMDNMDTLETIYGSQPIDIGATDTATRLGLCAFLREHAGGPEGSYVSDDVRPVLERFTPDSLRRTALLDDARLAGMAGWELARRGRPSRPAAPPRARHAIVTPAAGVRVERPRWLDSPLIPLGVITVIAGRAGVSKSTFSIDRAAKATRGRLDGDHRGRPVTVAFSAIEDGEAMQAARLRAAGADLDRVLFLGIAEDGAASGMRIPQDLPIIREVLASHDVKLWVLDPITSIIDGNTNKRDDVRRALDPLAALASDLGMAIIGIAHFNKGGGYSSDKLSGSHAFRDAVRSMLLIAKDDATGDCVLTVDKSNYSTAAGLSFSYALSSTQVRDDDGEAMEVPTITGFMKSERSVDEIINANVQRAEKVTTQGGTDTADCDSWLLNYLEDGPAPLSQIAEDARKCSPGYTRDQLKAARKRLGGKIDAISDPDHQGRGRSFLWRLAADREEP
ncbi:MAG: AAA family ATPase [Bifidobacterium dentium]